MAASSEKGRLFTRFHTLGPCISRLQPLGCLSFLLNAQRLLLGSSFRTADIPLLVLHSVQCCCRWWVLFVRKALNRLMWLDGSSMGSVDVDQHKMSPQYPHLYKYTRFPRGERSVPVVFYPPRQTKTRSDDLIVYLSTCKHSLWSLPKEPVTNQQFSTIRMASVRLPPLPVLMTWPKPNYVNPVSQKDLLLGFELPLLFITIVVVVLRAISRSVYSRLAIDDFLMFGAALLAIALMVVTCLSVEHGFGRHIWDVQLSELEPAQKVRCINYYKSYIRVV